MLYGVVITVPLHVKNGTCSFFWQCLYVLRFEGLLDLLFARFGALKNRLPEKIEGRFWSPPEKIEGRNAIFGVGAGKN